MPKLNELEAAELEKRRPETQKLLSYFNYDHLPEHLRKVSSRFWDLAFDLVIMEPESPELTVCLRKLLEAKDCAVRNAL